MNCPNHPKVKLRESNRGGYYCPAKLDNGKYCTYTATGDQSGSFTWPVDPVISKKVEGFTCPACRQKMRVYAEV